MEQAIELARIIRDAARAVEHAVASLEHPTEVRRDLEAIRELEHDGDRVMRRGRSP